MSPLDCPAVKSTADSKKLGFGVARIDLPNQEFPSEWETVLADL
jgi:hypothetical protein